MRIMPCLKQRRVFTLTYETRYLVLHASYTAISFQHSVSILIRAHEFPRYFIGHFAGIMESKWTVTRKEKKQILPTFYVFLFDCSFLLV